MSAVDAEALMSAKEEEQTAMRELAEAQAYVQDTSMTTFGQTTILDASTLNHTVATAEAVDYLNQTSSSIYVDLPDGKSFAPASVTYVIHAPMDLAEWEAQQQELGLSTDPKSKALPASKKKRKGCC